MFDFIKLPKGNGQTVYIDLKLLDIDMRLLIYDNYMLKVNTVPSSTHSLLHQTYNDAFIMLAEMGYRIIIDANEVDEDTFFFTPCVGEWYEMEPKEYRDEIDKKITASLLSKGIKQPVSYSVNDLFSQKHQVELPVVLKNVSVHGGGDKCLISTNSQLEMFINFLSYEYLTAVFNKLYIMQEYIETPTQYNTSLRVLVSSCGDILYSVLKYALPQKIGEEPKDGILSYYLLNEQSKYFLGGETFVSNTIAGGNNILLGEDNYSELERTILKEHGIDPDDATVPESIRIACQEVMKSCGKELGAICGMDFIYDVKDREWRYLEEHEWPMLYSYAIKYQLPYIRGEFRSDRDKELDLVARIHSLGVTMKKKRDGLPKRNLIQET